MKRNKSFYCTFLLTFYVSLFWKLSPRLKWFLWNPTLVFMRHTHAEVMSVQVLLKFNRFSLSSVLQDNHTALRLGHGGTYRMDNNSTRSIIVAFCGLFSSPIGDWYLLLQLLIGYERKTWEEYVKLSTDKLLKQSMTTF